jgi:very-short-patch-repair endonuclease
VCAFEPDNRRRLHTPGGDPGIAVVAGRQEGVVSYAQLRALGLSASGIDRRVRSGRLHLVHRGVYAVGHPRLTWRGRLWAAVLATGGPGRAAISHRSAAALWQFAPIPAGRIEVTTLLTSHTTAALHIHRARSLEATTDDEGLPLTTPARTLLDLADVLTPHRLERACHQAEYRRLLDMKAIDELIARSPGRRTRKLRTALATLARAEPAITRNKLEERFLELVAHAGLPRPRVNTLVEGHEVDFFWPDLRLVVETDGRDAHLTPTAFEDDRRRDGDLVVAGHRVLRLTRRQVFGDPGYVIDVLTRLAPPPAPAPARRPGRRRAAAPARPPAAARPPAPPARRPRSGRGP